MSHRWSPGAFRRDCRAAISVVTGISLVVIVGFTGAAVDFGSVYMQTRQLQGVADLAAMAAAGDLSQAQTAAQETVAANGLQQPGTATAVTGNYTPDPSVPAPQRFTAGGSPQNAVQVTVASSANLYFTRMFLGEQTVPISRVAFAATAQLASFSIGMRLAGLQGGVANALLSGLTGSSVSLSLMDYNALVGAQVDLFQYTSALASRLDLTGMSFNQTLAAQAQTNVAVAAIGDVLTSQGNSAASSAIAKIAQAANQQSINVGQLFDLGPYGNQDYVQGNGSTGFSINALDLANAVLTLAQGGHQVQLNLNGTVPGISNVTAWLAIGQRPSSSPWLTITDSNTVVVSTSQARLYIDAQVTPQGLPAPVASIDLPLYFELASAQAKLSSLSCSPNSVTLSVAPSIGEAAIGTVDTGQLNNFSQELTVSNATMINIPLLLQVTGQSVINLGGNDWQNVTFDSQDIQNNVVKTVSTQNAIDAALTSLVGNLSLNVQVLGLGLGMSQSQITSAVDSTLNGIASPLDSVVDELTHLTGVGLGEADVWVNGVRCQNVALVQ
ncbi:MAG TPA: TadG family pilus assembly protein [Rhizomicrobium sp.]